MSSIPELRLAVAKAGKLINSESLVTSTDLTSVLNPVPPTTQVAEYLPLTAADINNSEAKLGRTPRIADYDKLLFNRRVDGDDVMGEIINTQPQILNKIANMIGCKSLIAPADVFVGLLYLFNITGLTPIVTVKEVNRLSSLEMKELTSYMGKSYKGYPDHASMLFTALTGYYVPVTHEFDTSSYYRYAVYRPSLVYYLATAINVESLLHPYLVMAITKPSAILLSYMQRITNGEKIATLATELGMNPSLSMSAFVRDLIGYEYVLNRAGVPSPPVSPASQTSLLANDVTSADELKYYTNAEILRIYHNPKNMTISNTRTEIIQASLRAKSIYSWFLNPNITHCANGEIKDYHGIGHIDPITLAPYLETPGHFLGYGLSLGKYYCYKAEDLIMAWQPSEDHDYKFSHLLSFDQYGDRIPDFPVDSIKQLRTELEVTLRSAADKINRLVGINEKLQNELARGSETGIKVRILEANMNTIAKLLEVQDIFSQLLDVINKGLVQSSATRAEMVKLGNQYRTFTVAQQDVAIRYLSMMFLSGIFTRFWAGPDTDYPTQMKASDVCPLDVRDRKTVVMNENIKDYLKQIEATDEKLAQWLKDLPVVEFPWTDENSARLLVQASREKVNTTLTNSYGSRIPAHIRELKSTSIQFYWQLANDGVNCLQDVTDLLLKSTYYIMHYAFRMSLPNINATIKTYLATHEFQLIYDMMQNAVSAEPIKVVVKPDLYFNPKKMGTTGHFDETTSGLRVTA